MRVANFLFGTIRLFFYKIIYLNKLFFKNPIRFDKNAVITFRKHGKIILGKHVSLNRNSRISVTDDAIVEIGSYSGIGDNSIIVSKKKILIGDNVLIAPNVCIYDHDHNFEDNSLFRDQGFTTMEISIGNNVWVGAGCIILKGTTIGDNVVIAAGSIINKDIPANSFVYNKKKQIINIIRK